MRCRSEAGGAEAVRAILRHAVFGMVFLLGLQGNPPTAHAAVSSASPAAPVVAAAPAAQSALPLKRDDADGIGGAAAMATLVCVLLVCGWALVQLNAKRGSGGPARMPSQLRWLQRAMPAPRDQVLRVLESTSLSPHVRLHVVCWRNTEYLVSSSAQDVTVLDKVAQPEANPANVPAQGKRWERR